MCRLVGYFVVSAMIFTFHGQEVTAGPAPDPCLFGRRFRRPANIEAPREMEETAVVDGMKENMLQLETGSLPTSTIQETSEPEVLNNGRPKSITAAFDHFVERNIVPFLGMLLNSF